MRAWNRAKSFALASTLLAAGLVACPGKYDNTPKADAAVTEAMQERYKALIAEAKEVEAGQELKLLHHFTAAILSQTEMQAFEKMAADFVSRVKAGEFDQVQFEGGRAPGKARLLLVDASFAKGAVPFVKGADGWKIDDIEAGFGTYDKELNIKGNAPAKPPSSLAALALLKDPQADSIELVDAALSLARAKDRKSAEKYAAEIDSAWPKAALLYAVWRAGGECEPFAKAFPIAGEEQKSLWERDTGNFRTLLKGLCECAAEAESSLPMTRVYKGCHQVEGGPRSEYVDPVVEMANARPDALLAVSLKAGIPYDQDPMANILVGALHGEKESAFYQYLHKHDRGRGPSHRLARQWVALMAKRDVEEPPGSEDSY